MPTLDSYMLPSLMKLNLRENLKVCFIDYISIEEMTNYFKGIADSQEFTGLNLILGGYSIHLIECEQNLVNKILRSLNDLLLSAQTLYQQIWILHFTEEVSV